MREGRVLFIGEDAETTPATFKATRPKKVVSTFIGSQTLSKEYYPSRKAGMTLQLVVLSGSRAGHARSVKSKVKITAAKAEFDATRLFWKKRSLDWVNWSTSIEAGRTSSPMKWAMQV